MATKKKATKKVAKKTARKAVKKVTKRVTKKPAKKVVKRAYNRKLKPVVTEIDPIANTEVQQDTDHDPENWSTVNVGQNRAAEGVSKYVSELKSYLDEQAAKDAVLAARAANPVGAILADLDLAIEDLQASIIALSVRVAPYANLEGIPAGDHDREPVEGLSPLHTRTLNMAREIQQARRTIENITRAVLV